MFIVEDLSTFTVREGALGIISIHDGYYNSKKIILHENIILYFSIHKVLYACKMHKSSDAAQVETVKKLCTKEKCDINPKAVFGNSIECPGKI